jgi:hypothetical protein
MMRMGFGLLEQLQFTKKQEAISAILPFHCPQPGFRNVVVTGGLVIFITTGDILLVS